MIEHVRTPERKPAEWSRPNASEANLLPEAVSGSPFIAIPYQHTDIYGFGKL